MAVVKVTESWKQPSANIEGWPGVRPVIVGTHRIFTVKFSAPSADNQRISLTANDGANFVPAVGSAWSDNVTYLTCRSVRSLDPIGPTLFRVICEYSGMLSPFTQAPILRYSGMRHAEEVGHDATGRPYRNTVGQRLTGHTRDFYDKVFTLTRNEATDANVGGDWRGVVNSGNLTLGNFTWGPKKVKIEDVSAGREPLPAQWARC